MALLCHNIFYRNNLHQNSLFAKGRTRVAGPPRRLSLWKNQSLPKLGGGLRQMGLPPVVDRLVQQAILQALQVLFDPTFSDSRDRFRPHRSAHQALLQAGESLKEGPGERSKSSRIRESENR